MPRKRKPKQYSISVYGEMQVTRRQRIRPKSLRYSEKVRKRGYVRTTRYMEPRRWDVTGTKAELRAVRRRLLVTRAAPKRKHLKINAATFLRNPEKWEAEESLYLEQEYDKRRWFWIPPKRFT
jgi:hypothetical protein